MNEPAIVTAWFFGILSGSLITIGVASAVSARMVFNPARIDWSAGEARALGAVLAAAGVAFGLLVLVFTLRWGAFESIGPGFVFLMLLINTAGFIGISFVGHHHNRVLGRAGNAPPPGSAVDQVISLIPICTSCSCKA